MEEITKLGICESGFVSFLQNIMDILGLEDISYSYPLKKLLLLTGCHYTIIIIKQSSLTVTVV